MLVCEIVYLTLGIYELLSLINILYYLCNLNPYLLFIVVVVLYCFVSCFCLRSLLFTYLANVFVVVALALQTMETKLKTYRGPTQSMQPRQ